MDGPVSCAVVGANLSMRLECTIIFALFVMAGCSLTADGEVIFVDQNAPSPGVGSNWINAFSDLQDALELALPGDEIRVAQGTYRPDRETDNRNMSFVLLDDLTLRGGFAGNGSSNPDDNNPSLYLSILSGDIGISGDKSDNSYHIIIATDIVTVSELSGFYIRYGNSDQGFPDDTGGGIQINNSLFNLRECYLTHNSAISGGGVAVLNNSVVDFRDCVFSSNRVTGSGGGLHVVGSTVQAFKCRFQGNSSESQGGGLASLASGLDLSECIFDSNTGELAGGGAHFWVGSAVLNSCDFISNIQLNTYTTGSVGGGGFLSESGNPVIRNCVFCNNTSDANGGAINVRAGQLEVVNGKFVNNLASAGGGAIYSSGDFVSLYNTSLLSNTSLASGGAIRCDGEVEVFNSLFRDNIARDDGGGLHDEGSSSIVGNCIFWDNEDRTGFGESSQISGTGNTSTNFSCVKNLPVGFGGIANFSDDPLFDNPAGVDGVPGTVDDGVLLLIGSPCIDSGDPAFVPPGDETDFLGNKRIVCDFVDVGPYELQRLKGDATCDWEINVDDYDSWDSCASGPNVSISNDECLVFDTDLDGDVDLHDFACFLLAFTDSSY